MSEPPPPPSRVHPTAVGELRAAVAAHGEAVEAHSAACDAHEERWASHDELDWGVDELPEQMTSEQADVVELQGRVAATRGAMREAWVGAALEDGAVAAEIARRAIWFDRGPATNFRICLGLDAQRAAPRGSLATASKACVRTFPLDSSRIPVLSPRNPGLVTLESRICHTARLRKRAPWRHALERRDGR
jgi:hypothetical protein